jgi:hypothetical protein
MALLHCPISILPPINSLDAPLPLPLAGPDSVLNLDGALIRPASTPTFETGAKLDAYSEFEFEPNADPPDPDKPLASTSRRRSIAPVGAVAVRRDSGGASNVGEVVGSMKYWPCRDVSERRSSGLPESDDDRPCTLGEASLGELESVSGPGSSCLRGVAPLPPPLVPSPIFSLPFPLSGLPLPSRFFRLASKSSASRFSRSSRVNVSLTRPTLPLLSRCPRSCPPSEMVRSRIISGVTPNGPDLRRDSVTKRGNASVSVTGSRSSKCLAMGPARLGPGPSPPVKLIVRSLADPIRSIPSPLRAWRLRWARTGLELPPSGARASMSCTKAERSSSSALTLRYDAACTG